MNQQAIDLNESMLRQLTPHQQSEMLSFNGLKKCKKCGYICFQLFAICPRCDYVFDEEGVK